MPEPTATDVYDPVATSVDDSALAGVWHGLGGTDRGQALRRKGEAQDPQAYVSGAP